MEKRKIVQLTILLALFMSAVSLRAQQGAFVTGIGPAPAVTGSGLGDVLGAGSLTTAGAIPYVSAAGTLSQDSPGLFWDATNNRLGLGTASPAAAIDVASAEGITIRGTANLQLGSAGGNPAYLQGGGKFGVYFGTSALYINATTLSTGIGPSNTSPTGTMHVYDATASTGVTTLTVRAGAGQSSTNLQAWANSAGTTLSRVDSAGSMRAPTYKSSSDGVWILDDGNSIINMGSAWRVGWTSGSGGSTTDLSLTRSSANNLAITNGSSTNYWIIGAAGIQCGSGDGNSAACDVGTTGARVRNVNAAGAGTFVGALSAASVASTGTSAGTLQLSEASANGSNFVKIAAASSLSADTTYTWPSTVPSGNQVLQCGTPSTGVSTCSFTSASGYTKVPVPVHLFNTTNSGGASYNNCKASGGATGSADFNSTPSIAFPDSGTPTIECSIDIPKGWDGGTVEANFEMYGNTPGSGNKARITVDSDCVADGSFSPSFTSASNLDLTSLSAASLKTAAISALTLDAGCAEKRMVTVRIQRPTSATEDDFNANWNIIRASLYFLVNLQ